MAIVEDVVRRIVPEEEIDVPSTKDGSIEAGIQPPSE